MRCALIFAALLAGPAWAQPAPLYRDGMPAMAGDGAGERAGQPATLPRPAVVDMDRAGRLRFAAAYRHAGAPRVMIFWNRALTDDVDSQREAYARFSTRSQASADGWRDNGGAHIAAQGETSGEIRAGVDRLDPGLRASPHDATVDFDIERGFSDALAEAGVTLADRTTAMRRDALHGATANVQALEMNAVLGHADVLLEVVPLGDGDSYRITARQLRTGRLLANLRSNGAAPPRLMPYVAGEHGFVRAQAPAFGPYDAGRQIARDTMAALAARF